MLNTFFYRKTIFRSTCCVAYNLAENTHMPRPFFLSYFIWWGIWMQFLKITWVFSAVVFNFFSQHYVVYWYVGNIIFACFFRKSNQAWNDLLCLFIRNFEFVPKYHARYFLSLLTSPGDSLRQKLCVLIEFRNN